MVQKEFASFGNLLKLIALFPLQLGGYVLNALPILLGNFVAKKIAPATEFRAATAGVFSSVLYLFVWLPLLAFGISSLWSKSFLWLLLLLPVLGYMFLVNKELRRKFGASVSVNRIPPDTLDELLRLRKEILKTVLPDGS